MIDLVQISKRIHAPLHQQRLHRNFDRDQNFHQKSRRVTGKPKLQVRAKQCSACARLSGRLTQQVVLSTACRWLFSLMWKYESDEAKTTGGWILAMGQAKVVPHANAGKGPEVDGFDKAKVVFAINRLEIQDYPNHILAFGHDKWRCCILERKGDEWVKVR